MLNIAAHLALALGLLWYQKRLDYAPKLWHLTVFWSGLGGLLIYIEMVVLTRELYGTLHLQSAFIEIFYILPMYLALRWARRKKYDDIWHAFLIFLVFASFATLAAGWFLAYAPQATGYVFH